MRLEVCFALIPVLQACIKPVYPAVFPHPPAAEDHPINSYSRLFTPLPLAHFLNLLLMPRRTTGRWSSDEDSRLCRAVKRYQPELR
jgi:hypothetical protein